MSPVRLVSELICLVWVSAAVGACSFINATAHFCDGCRDAGEVEVDSGEVDSGGTRDAGGTDAGPSGPDAAPPRPVGPLSTSVVTSRRPTLRWELAPGTDGAYVELCEDRRCSSVIQVAEVLGSSVRPPEELPVGVVFWRLFGRVGSDTGRDPSPTWLFHVGPRSADADTSWGTTLDVNGDGLADVAVGSPGDTAGAAYLYEGHSSSALGESPVRIAGVSEGRDFGASIASAGDVNGDGFGDLIVGDPTLRGAMHLFFGAEGGLDLDSGQTLMPSSDANDAIGTTVAGVGDVNGDGYSDVIVGSGSLRDEVLLYLGSSLGLASAPQVLARPGGGGGFSQNTTDSAAGDINGDGLADIVIGVRGPADSDIVAYVYLGARSGMLGVSQEIRAPRSGLVGWPTACAGDVNGDGFSDVLVGGTVLVPGSGPLDPPSLGEGFAYLFFGSPSGLSELPVELSGEGALGFGAAVAGAGDVNGDGFADLLVGAPGANGFDGAVHFFAGREGRPSRLADAVLEGPAGSNSAFGLSVAGVGDLNQDGLADVGVGAPGVSGPGETYLYVGNGVGDFLQLLRARPLAGDTPGNLFGSAVARAVR